MTDARYWQPISLDERSDKPFTVHAELGEWRWWCHVCGIEKLVPRWETAIRKCSTHVHEEQLIRLKTWGRPS